MFYGRAGRHSRPRSLRRFVFREIAPENRRMRASAGENGQRRVAESGGQRRGGEPASPPRSVCGRSIADRRADVYEIPFLCEKNGCDRMRISVWGSEVLYVGIRSFVLLSFFALWCLHVSASLNTVSGSRPWEGRGRVPVPVLSSFGGFSFLLVRKLSGKCLFRRMVAQERKPQRRMSFDGRRMAGPFPFGFLGGVCMGAHRFSGQRMLLPSGS